MAKVFLTLESRAKTDISIEKINLLETNNIPFEYDNNSVFLISQAAFRHGISVSSREYDKPYSKFCMQLSDSADGGSIGMGEGSIENEILSILYSVFGDSLEFELTLSCGSESENLTMSIVLNTNTDLVEIETFLEEDEGDWNEEDEDFVQCSRCGTMHPLDSECDCVNIKSSIVESTLYKEEIEKIRAVCKEIEIKEIPYSEWANFFTSKGYDAKQLFKLEIYFNQFTFLIDNKDNKLPLEINFIEGKFAGWVKK